LETCCHYHRDVIIRCRPTDLGLCYSDVTFQLDKQNPGRQRERAGHTVDRLIIIIRIPPLAIRHATCVVSLMDCIVSACYCTEPIHTASADVTAFDCRCSCMHGVKWLLCNEIERSVSGARLAPRSRHGTL